MSEKEGVRKLLQDIKPDLLEETFAWNYDKNRNLSIVVTGQKLTAKQKADITSKLPEKVNITYV